MKKLLILMLPLVLMILGGCSMKDCYPNNKESCFVSKCKNIVRSCNNCGYKEPILGGIYIENCGDYLDRYNGIEF